MLFLVVIAGTVARQGATLLLKIVLVFCQERMYQAVSEIENSCFRIGC